MEQNILKWIQFDNKIKEYNDKMKLLKEERDKISGSMIQEVSTNSDLPVYNVTNLNTSIAFQKQMFMKIIQINFIKNKFF